VDAATEVAALPCRYPLTAEVLAITGGIDRYPNGDQLAAAAGIAPVRKQSGKVRNLQGARAGDKALKRVFYQSAFIAIGCDPTSKAHYARKRSDGKSHHQAVLALARRRVNVLHAMLRSRRHHDHRGNRSAALTSPLGSGHVRANSSLRHVNAEAARA
jgi:transposase